MRILDTQAARFDAPDPPRRRAEQEDVPRHALDREILVDGADGRPLGFGNNEIVRVVRNGAAGRDRGQTGAAPPPHDTVHPVTVQIRPRAAALGRDAVRQHRQHGVELRARQLAVRERTADQLEQIVLRPRLVGRGGHELLGEHVARPRGDLAGVECSSTNRPDERRAFDELVPGRREEPSLRQTGAVDLVARAADALQRHGDRPRRTDLTHEIDRADVDA